MRLHQNAKELVLLEVSGIGFLLGEIRYNRQTETALFALEKAAFLDLYFPCAVLFDQAKGPVVHPHILSVFTTSAVRIQRSRVSCFVPESDLNPALAAQYHGLLDAMGGNKAPAAQRPPEDEGPKGSGSGGKKRVVSLSDHAERK